MIIGANGTGKSTIVSAIVLGLGGQPKVIGRSSLIKDYVKANQEKAIIEIDLKISPNKVVRITRLFDKHGKTMWMVNNKSTNSKEILDLMKNLNIQV